MKKNIILIIVLFFCLNNAEACSCVFKSDTESIESIASKYDYIFKGRVVKTEIRKNYRGIYRFIGNFQAGIILTTFEILEDYKGKLKRKRVTIFQDNSNCKYRFDLQRVYLVYSTKEAGLKMTNQCTHTMLYSSQVGEELLKNIKNK